MVGTASFGRTGKPEAVGLVGSSSGGPPPALSDVGDDDMGNLNSASGLGNEVGDRRANSGLGVSGAVAVPGRRPLMLLSGGYDAWNSGDDCELGIL
jgi:hypothetical protein